MVRCYLGHNNAFEQFQCLKKTSFTILTENSASVEAEVCEKLSERSKCLRILVKKNEDFCHTRICDYDFVSDVS